MKIVLNRYEYEILLCASEQKEKFHAADIRKLLLNEGKVKIGEESVRLYLKDLARKKFLKKEYVKTGRFKWKPAYRSRYSKEYLLSHIKNMDSEADHAREIRNMIRDRRKLAFNPFVIAEPGYCSPDERKKIAKQIEQLD